MVGRLLLVSVAFAVAVPAAFSQADRRDRREPALILESGGRTGYCDVLKISPDGKTLLAAGDDKVVATWPISETGIDGKKLKLLRWPIWREQRGAIYAMDISPDGSRVAVGGMGMRNSTVAVIDRATGKIVASTFASKGQKADANDITALSFSADGSRLAIGTLDGSVWTWDFGPAVTLVGRHLPLNDDVLTWVRLVRFDSAGHVISIAEDGKLVRWTPGAPETLIVLKDVRVRAAAMSGEWLAASTMKPIISLRSLDGTKTADIELKPGQFPRGLAFSPDGKRLAVGIGSAVPDTKFFVEADDTVAIFEVGAVAQRIAEIKRPGRAEAIAWLGENRLAVAGGDSHEVVLWDLAKPTVPVSEVRGAGSGLWAVGLANNGRYLTFKDHRNPAATQPNDRGAGEWRAFDLLTRRFDSDAAKDIKPVVPLRTADNWAVQPDEKDSYVWYAIDPENQPHKIPLLSRQEGRPLCYTFIKKTATTPTRLVVGHYWGISIFDLTETGVHRIRLGTGHQGEVTAVAPSADGKWLVSCSNDQTISAWSLKDWPSGNVLGMTLKPDSLIVDTVDIGGPAWELGLVAGDEIVMAGGLIDNPATKKPEPKYAAIEDIRVTDSSGGILAYPKSGTAARILELIGNAIQGRDLFLVWKRPGKPGQIAGPTTIRTRPIWRFFPTRNNEWVLWMWQGSFYDCSTNGDFLIGWHMNDPTLTAEPRFFRAEQMRDKFWNKEVIDKLVVNLDPPAALKLALGDNPVPMNFESIEPPAVKIEVSAKETTTDVIAKLTAKSRDENPDRVPTRIELWINDYRFQTWKPTGSEFEKNVTIPVSLLRAGDNQLTLQVFNRLEGRSESVRQLKNLNAEKPYRAYGFAAGIDHYGASGKDLGGGKRADTLNDLKNAINDAKKQNAVWSGQKGKLYVATDIELKEDASAAPLPLEEELDRIAKLAQPDDRLIICLSGHGDFLSVKGEKTTFVFCGPKYNRDKYSESGLASGRLFEKLANIKCRKVVFLDACHSGDIAFNPIRALTPNGLGPTILAACDRSEYSYEHPEYGSGLFTYAIMQALGDGFTAADESKDGRLDAVELYQSVVKQMPGLLKRVGFPEGSQNPVLFPADPEPFPIYQK